MPVFQPCSPWNFPADRWPGTTESARVSPTESGVLIGVPAGCVLRTDALCAGSDGRLRVVFRTLSVDAWLGVELRRVRGNGVIGGLSVDLEPMSGRLRLVRWADIHRQWTVQPIVRWTAHPVIPPAGSWTTLMACIEAGQLTVTVEGVTVLKHALVHRWSGDHGLRIGGDPVVDGAVEVQSIEAWNTVEHVAPTIEHFCVGRSRIHLDTGEVSARDENASGRNGGG